jgi:hypothetical protein
MAHWFATIARVSGHGEQSDRVIELGTNDVRVGNPNWQADFKTEIGLVASQQCVVFLTVNPVLDIARPGGPTSAEFNAALAQAVATHANFHVLDWGDLEYGNPLWLMADHIHPTSAGSVEMALLEHDALRADCPR